MTTKEAIVKPIVLAASILLLAAGIGFAEERPPTQEERARVEAALRADGYTAWGEIQLDDGSAWEVDDAVDAEGREWDLELEAGTLVVSKKDD
ncbi:MAG: PepSY domain-containing protein [Mesorhizobium sp.]|nr:PepSY domain-containing protein [Mesorhizobium sp.]MCO5160023.1 PepSY domain-containing protein [Mesorhizobium sp.]